nr:SSH protein [Xenopus laevis]
MALVTLQVSSLDVGSNITPVQDDEKSRRKRMQRRQSFVMVKGAALLLQDEGEPIDTREPLSSSGPNEQQIHLQSMLRLLREEDTLTLAVRLEPVRSCLTRYLLVVSSTGKSNVEETLLLGVDFPHDGSLCCTIGTVLPIWSNTQVFLDGDGGFTVTSGMDIRTFKPISVQTMWSLLQMLHKACESALSNNVISSSLYSGLIYYQSNRSSPQVCLNAWTASPDIESARRDPATPEREETERIIKLKLRDILRESDLENITSKEVRSALEQHTLCALQDYKEFIDNEMIIILAQMDRPSEIFPYLYLGSEWNASNLEELQKNKVSHILNVTREIDNFFPELFMYLNIRVLDEENTNLMQYWKETHAFITTARHQGSRVLVHCKMGVSRSASTVIAYAMKEYEWTLETAIRHVKERRSIVQPNAGFMRQLQTYQGILGASKQRHSYLWDPSSAPSLPLMSPPPKNFSSPTTSPLTPRLQKMNLRTLMRSISEMEAADTISEEKESTVVLEETTLKQNFNVLESSSNNLQVTPKRNEHVLSKEQIIQEEKKVMELEKGPEWVVKNNVLEEMKETEERELPNFELPMSLNQSRERDQETIKESSVITQGSSSLDEVFESSTPTRSPEMVSYKCQKIQYFEQHSEGYSKVCFVDNLQSVSEEEKVTLVSKQLQTDEHGERKARITRQQNVIDTHEEL